MNKENRHKISDEQVAVEVSRDKMYGVISYIAPSETGKRLTLEEVRTQIEKKGIISGIDETVIEESFKNKKYGYKYIIAQGKPPIAGEPAEMTYYFNKDKVGKIEPKIKEDGTVDFKELGLVLNISKGVVLASKKLATEGEDGCNVLGQVVKATKGKDLPMPKGRNTELSESGLEVIASTDGQLNYDGQIISISPHYIIDHDVDSSVGNVDFIGNIIVNGGVHSGYTIKSGGNIEVRGPVEAATIIAEGDIVLWYGIQGGDKGKLVAKGNIITKFIQNAYVSAGHDIITEAIMHSEVAAGKSIMSDKGKGLIVGGNIMAGQGIYINTLGSSMATVTKVQLGQSLHLIEEYKNIERKYSELRDQCFKTDQNVSFLKLKGFNGLSPEKKAMLDQILKVQQQLKEELDQTQQRYQELKSLMQNVDEGIIKVKNIVYPGVRVNIGNVSKYFLEESHFCSIAKFDGEIKIGMY